LSEKDVFKINSELQKVLLSHINYGNSVSDAILFSKHDKTAHAPKYESGTLKLWLSGVNNVELLNNHKFLALKQTCVVHGSFLDKIFKTLAGGKNVAIKDFRTFTASQDFITKTILDILNSLMEKKFQFDSMTGSINRRAFETILNKELDEINRGKKLASGIVFVDVDHFKKVNDTFGHLAGDVVLQEMIKIIKTELRDSDIIARWGGEEFLVLLSGTNIRESSDIAERLREKIQDACIKPNDGQTIKITCSFGVSILRKGARIEDCVAKADDMLYISKTNGRNKVTVDK
jgi:diguanylate cyclase (GGDEF)-like protein